DGSRPEDSGGVDASVMLNFSVPLYEGGQLRSGERAAGYAVTSARAALDQARLNADLGLQNAILQWQKYSGRIDAQAARVDNMRVTRRLYRQQYLQLGTRSLLDLLNAEQEYYGALSDQIETEHELYRQAVDCLFYTGQLRAEFGLDSLVKQSVSLSDVPEEAK
ncbi:MAG: TolC family protein, partial [Alcaligenaceae bacterium]|nr:TolC family protein [Alcaligenaceae bacterium]